MKLHCTEKKPLHYFVTKLKWSKSLSLVTKLKICNWQTPVIFYQFTSSRELFLASSSAALQENNKTIFRQFKQQSTLCKKLISNKYFMVHDNEFCQFSLFTASFPENFQPYSALWCVIWGHGDNTTSDPSQILPTVFFWSWKRVDNHYFSIQMGIHVMHTTRPEPTLSKLTKLHTWKHIFHKNREISILMMKKKQQG